MTRRSPLAVTNPRTGEVDDAIVPLDASDIGCGDIGPFIVARQAEVVAAQIAEAVASGARILCGGTSSAVAAAAICARPWSSTSRRAWR